MYKMYEQKFHDTDLRKYKILITGGAGFIGSNLVEYLLKYNIKKIRVLDNFSTGFYENLKPFEDFPNFELIIGDIQNYYTCQQACKDINIVLHQAALGSVPRSINDPIKTNAVNITGFLNIINAARLENVKRIVYASSSSVYGDSERLPKVEEEIGKCLSPYALTKLVNEQYADIFAKTYDMELVGLRYFNVFGPKQRPKSEYAAVIPLFMDALQNKRPLIINGDGEQTRDFTFIENAVQANIKAAFIENKEAINTVYNIAIGEKTSLNKLHEFLNKKANADMTAIYVSARKGDIKNSIANIEKAKKLLNYNPAIDVRKGLEITLDWLMKTNKNQIL